MEAPEVQDQVKAKKKKFPWFTPAEDNVLANETLKFHGIISGSENSAQSNAKRNDIWQKITAKINTVSGNNRTVSNVV